MRAEGGVSSTGGHGECRGRAAWVSERPPGRVPAGGRGEGAGDRWLAAGGGAMRTGLCRDACVVSERRGWWSAAAVAVGVWC